MPKRFYKTTFLYTAISFFIAGWWLLAFRSSSEQSIHTLEFNPPLTVSSETLWNYLTPLHRNEMLQALSGDFALMGRLIREWDLEAKQLETSRIEGISHLPLSLYWDSQILCQLLTSRPAHEISVINDTIRVPALLDDSGQPLSLEKTFKRYLPHTYVAATFLLAIAQPHEIVAIPRGLRDLPHLYSPSLLKKIPLDADRQESEKLYLAHPDVAFMAHYSHPPTLQMLKQQQIKLCTIQSIDTLEQIQEALLKVGHVSNHILEANLLKIFMDAALLMLDNRLTALSQQRDDTSFQKLLYLSFYQRYSVPTTKSLSGQLVKRAMEKYRSLECPIIESESEWNIPFEQEKILHFQPDCLILATSPHQGKQALLQTTPALSAIPAFRTKRVFFLDDTIQKSPNQYIVLAYFDLVQAIEAAHLL